VLSLENEDFELILLYVCPTTSYYYIHVLVLLYTYIHAYIHTYIHTYVYTYIHAYNT
jgi:hypothetical protein